MREIFCVMAALGIASGALAADEALTREQARDVLKALHGGIRDFEFRYEGRYKRLRPQDTSKLPAGVREATERAAKVGEDSYFQATVAYRDDFRPSSICTTGARPRGSPRAGKFWPFSGTNTPEG